MGASVRLCLNRRFLSYVDHIRCSIMSHNVPLAELCPMMYMRNMVYIIYLQTSLHIFYIRHNGYCATNGQLGKGIAPVIAYRGIWVGVGG
jgi:hypothetical protein